jgi:ectoine hydroxylase-related dioxygenase (phytanoyl-CoA dioxygenase family)
MAVPPAHRHDRRLETAMPAAGLEPDQSAAFARDGFLHVRSVIRADELAELRAATDELAARAAASRIEDGEHLYQRDPLSGREVLHRINVMQAKSPVYLRLWGNPRLLAIAESVLGRDILPLAQALVLKTPGFGVAVPWHRDPAHCRIAHGVNLGIYLDDADAENGMLHAIPGSHRRRMFDLAEAVASHGFDLPGAVPVPVRAGDVIMHSENVLHGSREVRSQRQRRVLYFGFRSIPEQLFADRGLDLAWVHGVGRILQHAIRERSRAVVGRGEVPYAWQPTVAGSLPADDAPPTSLRITGHNAGPSPCQQLRFEDEGSTGDPTRPAVAIMSGLR